MSLIKVNGLVLRYADYREADRMMTVLTREYGRVEASARGCRRPKSPLMACSQPFTYAEFVLFQNKGKFTINQCELRESFYPLRSDLTKLSCGMYILACADEACQENEPNEPLFLLVYHALSYLAYGSADPIDLLLCFLLRYLDLLGYLPSITRCSICGKDVRTEKALRFSEKSGGVVCSGCGVSGIPVGILTLEVMRRMSLLQDPKMDGVRLSEKVRTELIEILPAYAQYRLDGRFKSLAFPSKF